MRYYSLSSRNNGNATCTFGIIHALRADTPGALQFLPETAESIQPARLRPIQPAELLERLDNQPARNLIVWDGRPRLSVAGVQHKINVLADRNGVLAFGEGSLCSTHILKFEPANQNHVVLNEYLLIVTAQVCRVYSPFALIAVRLRSPANTCWTEAEQRFAANLRDSIQQQTSRSIF